MVNLNAFNEEECYEPNENATNLEKVAIHDPAKIESLIQRGKEAMAEDILSGIWCWDDADTFPEWLVMHKRDLRIPDDWSFNEVRAGLGSIMCNIWAARRAK